MAGRAGPSSTRARASLQSWQSGTYDASAVPGPVLGPGGPEAPVDPGGLAGTLPPASAPASAPAPAPVPVPAPVPAPAASPAGLESGPAGSLVPTCTGSPWCSV